MCQQTKNGRHPPDKELQPLQIPERAWSSVLLDFIIKLLLFREPIIRTKFNSILIVVD